jgi:hypothetical protein
MKLHIKRYDFANSRVIEYDRDIPDEPIETPLLAHLRKKAKSSQALTLSSQPQNGE